MRRTPTPSCRAGWSWSGASGTHALKAILQGDVVEQARALGQDRERRSSGWSPAGKHVSVCAVDW